MKAIRRLSAVFALSIFFTPGLIAQDDVRDQQEKQRQVQAETDHVVKRITTMMRVMQFYEVKSPEQEVLKEMSGTLAGLSKNQMTEVIRQLELAANESDEKLSDSAREKAYDNHRQVLAALHEMVARFDAIKSLDQAADRFDKYAKGQLDLHLRTSHSIRDLIETSKPDASPTMKLLIRQRVGDLAIEMRHNSDNQGDLLRDVSILVKQVKDIAPKLPAEQQERVKTMDKLLAESRLHENMTIAGKKLRTVGYPEIRQNEFKTANDLQWKSAANLQAIARALRIPSDALAALREAREKIDQAIAKQEEIKDEVKIQEDKAIKEDLAKKEEAAKLEAARKAAEELAQKLEAARKAAEELAKKNEAANKDDAKKSDAAKTDKKDDAKKTDVAKTQAPPVDPKAKIAFPDMQPLVQTPPTAAEKKAAIAKAMEAAINAEKNADIAKKQTKNAFDTKDTENLLKPFASQAAENLAKAEAAMKDIKDNLLKNDAKKAAKPQEKAVNELKAAKAEIDKMIAAAEKAKSDPLAAVNKAIEDLDKIIKDQTTTRDETKETVGDKQNLKLPELADKQKDLANKTEDVKNAPLPNPEKVQSALDKATKEMKAAAKNLDNKKSPEAVAKQDKALDALKDARKELADKAAEIEKRRDDIAKLEDAAKKLDDLTKQEKNVAKNAEANADQSKKEAANKDLAKQQGELTPKAKELAKEVDKAAPKAAEKIAESTKNMQAAKKELDKNAAKPAAKEAKEAAKKLDDAQKALEQALNELKGKEIADQAAMQMKDQANIAQQVAKALEETQKAAQASKDAQMKDAKADLAKQQAQLAKDAATQKQPMAAQDAAKAAQALEKGDLPKTLENQAKALKQLQEAGAKNPMPGEKSDAPKQLAEKQQALMDATKALAQSQQATQAAQAALAQAQAQAPMAVQPQLQKASDQLQNAAKQLAEAKPAQAGQAQEQAAKDLGKALDQLNEALAQAGQPKSEPGQPQQSAKNQPGQPKDGQGEPKDGQGEPKDGQGQAKDGQGQPKDGQGQAKGKDGKAQEQNQAKGEGDRKADGTVSNKNSMSNNANGDGSFLHLPPRQRELIRQAISGNLPPEYANLIQQYYINIARGRPAAGSTAPAPAPQAPR